MLIARYRQHEADHLCRIAQASAWIAPEMWDKIDYRPIIADVLEKNRQVRNVIMVRATESCRYRRLEDLIAPVTRTGENVRRLEAFRPDASQVAHMGPTGGSTGMPKVAPCTHNELLCSMEYAAAAWEMTLHDKTLLATPIGHDLTPKGLLFGINVCISGHETTGKKPVSLFLFRVESRALKGLPHDVNDAMMRCPP